jgi:hypothetical protein
MAIVKKECWVDTNGGGIGYCDLKDAVKKRIKFIITRFDGTMRACNPWQAIIDNYEEIYELLGVLINNCNKKDKK